MEFCNKNTSPALPEAENNNMVINECEPHDNSPIRQNEPHTFDLNALPSVSTPPNISDDHHPYTENITSISTSKENSFKNWDFDLNQLPQNEFEYNEYEEDVKNNDYNYNP